jgi:gliding motility-associated-like protein
MTLLKKTLLSFSSLLFLYAFGQTTETFTTGGTQTWTVPNCVQSIDVEVAGAQGGGTNGGNGAVITATIPVTPGQVLEIYVGEQGGCPAAGIGGGGAGQPSSIGLPSCAGGGYSAISLAPGGLMNAIVVAGGGGGTGGGTAVGDGGDGGCPNGAAGSTTYGYGGGAGTTGSGGIGGGPWTAGGGTGGNGSFGQGGAGGVDIGFGYNPGGGGGGGYYGGGGGGSDNISLTSAAGGGGGGGGSSLIPAGAGCGGTNTGDGYVNITYIGGLSATASNTGDYCSGETIELFASGGANYSWTGPNGFTSNLQNPTIPNSTTAMSGTYTVEVTDPNCPGLEIATTDVLVNQSPTVDPISDITVCNGEVVNVPSFTGNSPGATYAWTNTNTSIGTGPSGNGDMIAFFGTATTNDQVGTITVTPTNAICVGPPETFTITVLRDPSITVSNDTLICENGTANLLATATGGGGGPYIYHWDHTADQQGNQDVNPLVPSSYTVYAESPNGCVSNTETIDVTLHPPLSGNISPWDTICPGYPTDIFADVSGGIGQPYQFAWSSGEVSNGPDNHMINVNPPSTTDYTVTITDGCETTPLVLTTNIFVAPLPVPQYEVLDPEQCEPAIFHVVNTTDPALSQYVYWLVDGEHQYLNQDTIVTPEFYEGTYDIQMIVTSFEGCVDSTTFYDALNVKPKPIASFQHSPNPVQMFNTNVIFTSTSFLAYEYEWYFEQGNPSWSGQPTTVTQFPDGETGSYDVQLIVTSELGCKDTANYELIVFPEVLVYAPNTFTPDNDEFNQDWKIYISGVDIYDFELLIFNRWGEIVWESHDPEVSWDGTFNGEKVPVGTYNWTVTTKDLLNDDKYTFNGHVNIIR